MRWISEKSIHEIFEVGVVIKGIDGLLELFGALALGVISPVRLSHWAVVLTQHELSQDPNDFLATHIVRAAAQLSVSTKLFEALYLLIHGVVKIFLVWGLLKNRLWAYPTAIVFLLVFMGYQLYRYTETHAWSLIALTIFDGIILVLTWHEYKFVKKQYAA